MPPTCALLGIAVPEKPGDRPFRFLDLPGEIRNMVYRLLMGRRVVDGVVEIDLVKRYASIENCYYPAMMRVNKQVEDEYAAFVIPRMLLSVFWTTTHMSETSTHQILPKKVLSQMKFFEMSVWINHPLSDLDSMLLVGSPPITNFVDFICSFLPCDSSGPGTPL